MSDKTVEQMAAEMQAMYGEDNVVAGSRDLAEKLGMRCIQDFSGLIHLGFGDFRNAEYVFTRYDHSSGSRFYRLTS